MLALGCLRERTHSIQFRTLAVVDESAPVSAAVSAGARSESLVVASWFGFISISAAARSFRPPVGVISLVSRFKDRKSTRLNSSHLVISYAVFCLKKKKSRLTSMIHSTSTAYTLHPLTS